MPTDALSPVPITRQRELEWLDVTTIVPSENNPRNEPSFTESELASLRVSIEQYGVLQPLIVQPYSKGMYKLVEGERRWRVAKLDNIKELPAIIVNRVSDHAEVQVMFHIHQERRPWAIIEEARAIHRLMETNGDTPKHQMARELNMSPTTLNERLILIGSGEDVMADVARGALDPKAVVHAAQVARLFERHRPDLTAELGGQAAVNDALLKKARERGKGVAEELKRLKNSIADAEVSDAALHAYVSNVELTSKDVARDITSVPVKQATSRLRRRLSQVRADARALVEQAGEIPERNVLLSDLEAAMQAMRELRVAVEAL
jgi:ParB/RepB/Spo0J family partition protein